MKKLSSSTSPPFWRDKRVIPILLQAIFALLVMLLGAFFFTNALGSLKQMGMSFGYDFLGKMASFDIGDKLIEFSSTDTYGKAFLVGILNTIKVALIGIILATILGFIIGISRLSNNWLAKTVATVYVEVFRNTPLLVQIFIWFYAVFLSFPSIEKSLNAFGLFYFSNRGTVIPWFELTPSSMIWFISLLVGLFLSYIVWKVRIIKQVETGQRKYPSFWALGSLVGWGVITWIFTLQSPLLLSVPVIAGRGFDGGYTIGPGFGALLVALVMYTASYIAEIVRGGILAVPKGQVEAAKALGLKSPTILRLVILPQAIRIIIPPLTNQYLNLIKNSSLAAAVAYPELVGVGITVLSQTGKSVEVISIVILVYLSMSLFTSLLMNIFNKYTQLVER
ncbi:amino acid ABC transporter permease [Paenisporosarcina sp. OV554]|uniref:amino acid ABC transporter permease n=1 Tax=Paenisporosarcina sp. OV554 TaxID=2135694 RepID=UPI000D3D3F9C|nr:ABC transporter permease subunit [Paenisporosarcina sp. OV554]PUB11692.1 amino acid ABC transporter membrane protein 1 (PAAT family) [Paenisporosarcina sp. OV554]